MKSHKSPRIDVLYPVGVNFLLDKSRRMTYISTMVDEKGCDGEEYALPPARESGRPDISDRDAERLL